MVSVEAQNRSFAERLRLNHAILKNKYWYLPVDDKGHENYSPVGRGVRSSEFCGRWVGFLVCKNVEAHKGVLVGTMDCTDKVVVRHQHLWCHKSSCPVCFNRGWAVREAHSMQGRLDEGVKRGFGKVEHFTVSFPDQDKCLPESVLREKARMASLVRGILGAGLIFHGYREAHNCHALEWHPHFHGLGYIRGGFDVCRGCDHERGDCASCSGFKGREVREYAKDKCLVKVFAERETIYGTAWYQLNHATIRLGVKRFQVVTWFGVVSYRMFKSDKVKSENSCPACHDDMGRAVHVGKRHIVKDIGSPEYVPMFVDDEFDASGLPNYIDVVGSGRFG
jgi:hypothetical protein